MDVFPLYKFGCQLVFASSLCAITRIALKKNTNVPCGDIDETHIIGVVSQH